MSRERSADRAHPDVLHDRAFLLLQLPLVSMGQQQFCTWPPLDRLFTIAAFGFSRRTAFDSTMETESRICHPRSLPIRMVLRSGWGTVGCLTVQADVDEMDDD